MYKKSIIHAQIEYLYLEEKQIIKITKSGRTSDISTKGYLTMLIKMYLNNIKYAVKQPPVGAIVAALYSIPIIKPNMNISITTPIYLKSAYG